MNFKNQVPEWKNSGTEPSESLKESGFLGGYKPPASVFNWFWHGIGEAVKEIQNAGTFAYLGDNPVNKDGDTVDAWVALGSGYARYTDAGTLTDKPSKYGVLLSVCVNGKDLFQLWYVAPTGPLLHRGGNASGWSGTWKKVYDTANKPAITDILTSQLSVALGGTGATTKKDAFKNLAFLGQNPIASIEDDTIENWVALGSGFAWISELDRLNNQPSNYGLLINYVPNSYEVTQIWKTHSSGPMYIRSGNRNGWGQQWTKIYDTANKPTPAEIGATPIINAESANYDMDAIAVSGDHAALYITNQFTLGTPYKQGVTNYTESLILSYGSSKSYAMQVAFVSGNQPFVRYLHDGTLSDWFNILTSAQPVTMAQGGTNADNRKDAMYNIAFIGENPIALQVNDTSDNWVKLGTGYAWYNGSNQLLNQPSQYGMLLNFVSGVEVTQIWKCHATGPMWIRSGNKAGWGQVWTKVFDTLNPPSADNITGILPLIKGGTGANSAAGALANLGAFRNLGKQVISAIANDTVAKWSAIDSGYTYYETAGLLTDQPTQYGILIHFHQSTEVFQIWRTQSGGPTYWRSGNAKGWESTWAKVYDRQNKPTPADIGAAPAGYGLGEEGGRYITFNDIDTAIKPGFYGIWTGGTLNNISFGHGRMIVTAIDANSVTQVLWPSAIGCVLVRHIDGGILGEWECANPPMATGVEYRTTERYNGKPVYAKHITTTISMEANTGVVDIEVPHGISDFGKLVRVNGEISGSTESIIFPCISSASKSTSIYKVTTTNIILRAINEYWNRGLIFNIYYTKATD